MLIPFPQPPQARCTLKVYSPGFIISPGQKGFLLLCCTHNVGMFSGKESKCCGLGGAQKLLSLWVGSTPRKVPCILEVTTNKASCNILGYHRVRGAHGVHSPALPACFQVSSVVWSATVHPTKIHRCCTTLPANHLPVRKRHRGDKMLKKFSTGKTNSASTQILATSTFQPSLTLEMRAELRCPILISLISADEASKEGERDQRYICTVSLWS